MELQRMHYAGFCRLCGTGPLGLRSCGQCQEIVVLCDECDAIWTDANFNSPATFGEPEELDCPHCQASLLSPSSHWSTAEELLESAWVQAAIKAGELKLEVAEAREPEINTLPPTDADDDRQPTGG